MMECQCGEGREFPDKINSDGKTKKCWSDVSDNATSCTPKDTKSLGLKVYYYSIFLGVMVGKRCT